MNLINLDSEFNKKNSDTTCWNLIKIKIKSKGSLIKSKGSLTLNKEHKID